MTNLELARWYVGLLGVSLVVFGLAGFVDNPIVGAPAAEPVFSSGTAQNVLYVFSGALALFIAFGLSEVAMIRGLLLFGLTYALLLVLTVASPSLLGLFEVEVNLAGHVLHAGVATISLTVAWLARRPAREFTSAS